MSSRRAGPARVIVFIGLVAEINYIASSLDGMRFFASVRVRLRKSSAMR
jgi:hypothetical protein